jgi:SAM-dependent methyltransferase
MLLGTLPLLWWVGDRRQVLTGMALVAAATAAVTPSIGQTIWSPYQKLVGRHVSWAATPGDDPVHGYLVDISDVFYQVALDLRPEAVARLGENPFPHYDQAFRTLPQPIGRVLVVGAGTGNDVAGALRAGATHVDAVDIDPAIVGLGRRYHPERPYDDPRVRVVIDDARAAFRDLQAGAYDVVVFGLLDSHTQLGISSVRLDNYVFTLESFAAARRLLRPGGSLVVTAATFREWFRERFVGMLAATCDTPVRADGTGLWVTYTCRVTGGGTPGARAAAGTTLPTDDWPFLYLPARGVPGAYALVVLMLAMGSVLVVRANGLSPARFTAYHGHVFFLGAAFLLMEVYAINRLALLFGTTWVVSAVAIILVLTLIVAANLTLALAGAVPYPLAYAGLLVSLLVSFWLDPATVLGRGTAISLAYGLVVLLPVYFAGLVFARSFTRADVAGPAIGANMLGAVLGGWTEYATMALGIRALALLALAFYLGSLLCLLRERSVTGTSLRAARPAGRGTAA